ncbi:MAG: TIM barrel protein [Tannerella sp.]|jgi:hydroxypyruvate isomerase|nr:TIM barrel protein [Tannerella sp.]
MKRRNFIAKTAGVTALTGIGGLSDVLASMPTYSNKSKFTLKYAPTLGMFNRSAGKDPVDNLKFIADNGFRAAYDLGMGGRPVEEQEKIAAEAARLGLELGQFSFKIEWGKPTFVLDDDSVREIIRKRITAGLEVQKRTGINTGLIVPGMLDNKLHPDIQTANVIRNVRYALDIIGDSGLTIVLEPLNRLTNHPGAFLTRLTQGKMICQAVNHPGIKIVDDIYHQQITEGNLVPNLKECWDYVGSIHIADNPGRNEPTTGEINYHYIFKWLYERNYDGVISLEHGQSKPDKAGEEAIIQAYRNVDPK